LLHEFTGSLTDRKVTYLAELAKDMALSQEEISTWGIYEYPRSAPTHRLIQLAIASSASSRFRADSRIPAEKTDRLYSIWMNRSTSGEMADAVLVARSRSTGNEIGMITISIHGGMGQIGLIAVSEEARGQGIGLRLLRAAHWYMLQRGARRSSVVTQMVNTAACRLYERGGYGIHDLQHYYHFWPQDSVNRECGPSVLDDTPPSAPLSSC
jgi:ribosomal protein S18 acetylase RimI-like enzyme